MFFCGSARGNGKTDDHAAHESNRGARAHAQRSGDVCRVARTHAQTWSAHEESVIFPRTTTKKIFFFVVVRGEMEKRTTARDMRVTEARVHMRKEAAMRAELRVRMRKDGDVRVHTSG